ATPQQQGQQITSPVQQQQQTTPSQNNFALEQEAREEGYFPWLGGQAENNFRTPDGRNTVRPVSDLVGRVRVVPDQRSNALLISANVHCFPQIITLLQDIDAPKRHIAI